MLDNEAEKRELVSEANVLTEECFQHQCIAESIQARKTGVYDILFQKQNVD